MSSRSSNRGPRADIALLRKLKADPNFSPSSLLNSGPNILEKANKLKGFVAEQRGKLGATAAKTEWLLAFQQLQGDQDDAERELTTCLQQLAEQPGPELREVAEALYTLQSQTEACRAERLQLRSQVRGLSSVHSGYKAYGAPAEFSREANALKGEITATGRELQGALAQLNEQAAALSSELRDAWPSAVAAPGGGVEGLAAAVTAGGAEDVAAVSGYSLAEDVEELERMMARYPLAAQDVKERIREVFLALQEKFLERLETWRLEAEQAAQDLARSAPASRNSHAQLPQRLRAPMQQPRNGGGRGAVGAAGASRAAVVSPAVGGAHLQGGRGGGSGGAAAGPKRGGGPQTRGRFGAGGRDGGIEAGMDADAEGLAAGDGDGGGSGSAAAAAASNDLVALPEPGAGWAFSGYGGWSAEEHSAFVRHRDRLMKEGGQGPKSASREALMSRIAMLLPGGRSAAEVKAHDDWTTAARLLGRRRRDLAEGWDRERRQFLEDSSSFLQESEALFLLRAEEAADRLVAELLRERARDELEELRAERAHEEEVAAAERAAREAAEAEARILAEARERQDRAVKKDMIAAYRAELERQQAEAAAAAAAAELEAAALAEQQAVYNRERVEVRQAEYLERQEQAKERLEAAEAEERARAARLDRLRALVAPQVEADPARVMAPTAASAAEMDKAEGAFHPVNGYTTDQVVKDQRFKVMEALAAVGLHGTDYGRRVIAAARPANPTRPDNLTSTQLEVMRNR